MVEYIRLAAETPLPSRTRAGAFKCILVVEDATSAEWRSAVADWLVASGCLYMMAWGLDASSWDDAVDEANCLALNFNSIPDEHFVLTTWHEGESLEDVFWYAKNSAKHDYSMLSDVIILHIGSANREAEFRSKFDGA